MLLLAVEGLSWKGSEEKMENWLPDCSLKGTSLGPGTSLSSRSLSSSRANLTSELIKLMRSSEEDVKESLLYSFY